MRISKDFRLNRELQADKLNQASSKFSAMIQRLAGDDGVYIEIPAQIMRDQSRSFLIEKNYEISDLVYTI